jgi:hypothetical protein
MKAELKNDTKTGCTWPSKIFETIIYINVLKEKNSIVSSIDMAILIS